MKKFICCALVLMFCFVSCFAEVNFGLVCLHDELSSYDENFIVAAQEAAEKCGANLIIKKNVPESNDCYEAIADLVDEGCTVIFADSFGHETFVLEAAKEYPEVQFCHATGTMAHTENLPNYHNAFASIYEGRYLAGVAAGLKANEMGLDAPCFGYVGAFTYAEVISGLTSFYLGAKSICPNATMKVQFTGSWYDEKEEKAAAEALIGAGCQIISAHADSHGAPTACENAGVPYVGYNVSFTSDAPNTFIVSTKINWEPYFEYILTTDEIATDWVGTIATGSVQMTEINEKAAAQSTAARLLDVQNQFINGTLKVFDTSTFTVEGKVLESYLADVNTDAQYEPDTEVVSDGYFHESEYRSAPYFDIKIDGIEFINSAY